MSMPNDSPARSDAPHSTADPIPIPQAVEPTDLPRRLARWLLGWPLSWAVGSWIVLLLVGWIPHYLTWPWFVDQDYFAVVAQLWDAGTLPYRDFFCFQFPGETYFFWILGKVFGWGNSVAFYAVDVALVLAFGGRWWPGTGASSAGPCPG